jgi:hypothetical protein
MTETFGQRTNKRLQQELDEFHADWQRMGQQQLDTWWQRRLDERAEARRRIERPGVVCAEAGIYDPVARFESEVRDGLIGWSKF